MADLYVRGALSIIAIGAIAGVALISLALIRPRPIYEMGGFIPGASIPTAYRLNRITGEIDFCRYAENPFDKFLPTGSKRQAYVDCSQTLTW